LVPVVVLIIYVCWCRVRGILDSALAAADCGGTPDASTPASVLQQLAQARQLYESDKAASWGVVERVLADVEDAQVGWRDVHRELLQAASIYTVNLYVPSALRKMLLQIVIVGSCNSSSLGTADHRLASRVCSSHMRLTLVITSIMCVCAGCLLTNGLSLQALLMLMASPPAEISKAPAAAAAETAAAPASFLHRFAGGAAGLNSSRGSGASPARGRGSFQQLDQLGNNSNSCGYGMPGSSLQQQQHFQGQDFLQAAGGPGRPWFASHGMPEVLAGNAAGLAGSVAGQRRSGSSRGRQRTVNGKRSAAGMLRVCVAVQLPLQCG
jgi:hypothetical protein